MIKQIAVILVVSILFGTIAFAQSQKSSKSASPQHAVKDSNAVAAGPIITFIELGSVKCIPCRAMQPVMKSIEGKYGARIKIVFYDVWKADQRHYAEQYSIRLIPTQVFLDSRGTEIMRHEGFFPEKDIDAFLQSKGLSPNTGQAD
jgi:thioredoxin 1